jgi:hypothetical protein
MGNPRSLGVSFIVLVVLLVARSASADDNAAAAKAFSQGQAAMLEGDAAKAAEFFELADNLAPSAPALRNAARARVTAGHKAVAATHAAELLRRYHSDADSRAVAEALLSELAPELARIDVTCTEKCDVLVDGMAVGYAAREDHSFFVQPGDREVVAEFEGGRKASSAVSAPINAVTPVKLEAPAKEVTPDPSTLVVQPAKSKGIRRRWFVGGAILTVVLGGVATASGLQTLQTRDDIKTAVEEGDHDKAVDLYDKGGDQQIRTNVLLGATAAVGAVTILLAVFTDWSGGETEQQPALGLTTSSDAMTITYGGRF